ncbi:MAG: TRAP transporter substrate-binding protein [Bacillota bacterium]|nr:TRAP transporter substrate-binding protein [Bacillota bacterium]
MGKRMFIIIVTLLLVFSISFVAVGCSGQRAAKPGEGPVGKAVELKFAHHWAAQSPFGRGMQYFADVVNEESGGQLKVEVFAADSLVTGVEMYEAMLDGIVDIGFVTTSQISPKIRELTVLEIPGIYDLGGGDFDYFDYAAEIRPNLEEIYEEYGMVFLYAVDPGDLAICSTQPIQDISDFNGKRIRDYGVWAGKVIEALGATPMTIPPGDVTLSLERNIVDAAMGTWGFVDGFKLYEQGKHITWLGVGGVSCQIFMKQDTFDALTTEQQQIIRKAASDAMHKHTEFLEETKEAFIRTSEAVGVTHYHLSDDIRAEMFDKFDTVFENSRDIVGPKGNDLLDKLLRMR